MTPHRRTRVKVCCIATVDEARLAVRHGADAVGLVAAMPSGPGPIPEPLITEIAATVPPPTSTFLLTSETNVAAIIEQQRRCRANTLQLVDRLEHGRYEDLRAALPGVSLVQVVHVTGEEAVEEAVRAAEEGVDAVLLDSGDQRLAVKPLGGTGRVHDWAVSRRVLEAVRAELRERGRRHPVGAALRGGRMLRPPHRRPAGRVETGGLHGRRGVGGRVERLTAGRATTRPTGRKSRSVRSERTPAGLTGVTCTFYRTGRAARRDTNPRRGNFAAPACGPASGYVRCTSSPNGNCHNRHARCFTLSCSRRASPGEP